YEMFLDKGGKKISKSLGNVLTAQRWMEFGSPKSILLLLYKRITGARELGLEDIPSLMSEYNELEDIFFGRIKVDNPAKLTKSKGLYEYVNLLNPPKQASTHVNYRLLVELSKIFKEDRKDRVMKKLLDYGVIKNPEPEIEQLIEIAGNYSDEFDEQEKTQVDLDETAKKVLRILVEKLEGDEEPEDIQNTIYQIAKSNDVQPKDFFRILYQIILGTSRGPKIGPFISDIGRKQVAKTISEYV
ncbi:MAG: lysine--tRNA ligase, partial [Nitrosopumilus sp. (ex Thoosa mismalolli)]|nr:lysine--tRNA ligase [Nitrosopumilus sp. (ex Thoosa mismalolli)]